MSISSISSLSPLIQSLQSSSSNSGGNTNNSIGGQLLAELAQAQATNGSSSDPLLQTLVSLGSGSGSSSAATSPLTYNAKGLLNQVQYSLMLNDPLLQSSDATSGDSESSPDASLLSNLLGSSQGNSTAGAATGTGTSNSNIDWAQILQKDPSLASAFAESQMHQGILNMLP